MKTLNGKKVIVQHPFENKVKRKIVERLFSRPWNPRKKYKIEYKELIEDDVVIHTKNSFIMNQKTYNILIKHDNKSYKENKVRWINL